MSAHRRYLYGVCLQLRLLRCLHFVVGTCTYNLKSRIYCIILCILGGNCAIKYKISAGYTSSSTRSIRYVYKFIASHMLLPINYAVYMCIYIYVCMYSVQYIVDHLELLRKKTSPFPFLPNSASCLKFAISHQ